jgi:restriction system protein
VASGPDASAPIIPALVEVRSPDELIDSAARELHDSLSRDLLEQIAAGSPTQFEQLVLDVLHAMGYGAKQSDLERTGASGDGGIDGIITLDRLGLEKVYVQAKRWTSGTVGRPEIQKFFGALAGRRATRGVFITASTFSGEAKDYARQVSDSIVLIDGCRLASLMIEYGVGVTVQRTIKIAKIDSDYFEDQ